MRKIACILILGCIVGYGNLQAVNLTKETAQIVKPNDDIKVMFQNEQYQRIIDTYANTPRNLSSEELTYVAQSYSYISDLGNAHKYIDLAINKDKKSSKALYVKGVIYNMEGKPEQAIENLNKAIALSPKSPEYYAELGDVYFSMDNDEEALDNYRKAIGLPNPAERAYFMIGAVYAGQDNLKSALDAFYIAKSKVQKDKELYVTVLYNIGNIEYNNRNYKNAIDAYKELMEYFPDDYYSLEKLVQCYNALELYDASDVSKAKLYEAYEKGDLSSSSMSDMFCLDQFSVGNKGVLVYERFEEVDCRSFVKNIFYVTDTSGNIESIITLKYEPSESDGVKGHFEAILEKGSDQYRFNTVFEGGVRYSTLKPYISDVIAGKVEAILVNE